MNIYEPNSIWSWDRFMSDRLVELKANWMTPELSALLKRQFPEAFRREQPSFFALLNMPGAE